MSVYCLTQMDLSHKYYCYCHVPNTSFNKEAFQLMFSIPNMGFNVMTIHSIESIIWQKLYKQ